MSNSTPFNRVGASPKVLQTKQPVAPPVYRPQPLPKVLQRRQNSVPTPANTIAKTNKPVAPPVYRPQSLLKVLQTKPDVVPSISVNRTTEHKLPVAPPVYRPQMAIRKGLGKKRSGQSANSGAIAIQPLRASDNTHRPSKIGLIQPTPSPKAPPVYRPNPASIVMQPQKAGRLIADTHRMVSNGTNPATLLNPGSKQVFRLSPVIQPIFYINDFQKKSNVEFKSSKHNNTKTLITLIRIKIRDKQVEPLSDDWESGVNALADSEKEEGDFTNVAHFINKFSVIISEFNMRQQEIIKRKRDDQADTKKAKKQKIANQQSTHISNVQNSADLPKLNIGLIMQQSSFKKMRQLVDTFKASNVFKENVETLQNTISNTDGGGIRHTLKTGNKFQSMLVFSQSELDTATKSVNLDDVGINLKKLGQPSLPKKYVSKPNERLINAVLPGKNAGSYQPNKVMKREATLEALEMMRFFQLVLSHSLRKTLKKHNKIDEHDPTGNMALYEVQKATSGGENIELLFSHNSATIYEQIKLLPPNTELGKHHLSFPNKTRSTVKTFTDAFDALILNHDKDTQNNFNREVFRIVRAEIGPLKDDTNQNIVIDTPPSSPRKSFDAYD